jgi:hypothetical protein
MKTTTKLSTAFSIVQGRQRGKELLAFFKKKQRKTLQNYSAPSAFALVTIGLLA